MKTDKAQERIKAMEAIFDKAAKVMQDLEKHMSRFEDIQSDIKKLEAYYTSEDWKNDFKLDEEGLLPDDLKRGVLSEDGVYDLLEKNKELLERVKEEEKAKTSIDSSKVTMLHSRTKEKSMKIYDISQEVFGCQVYPGDPSPERQELLKISNGNVCNLTAFNMCAHNGTHVDAPYHFIDGGKTIDQIDMKRFVGYCYVVSHDGDITEMDAKRIIKKAGAASVENECDCVNRILVKGKATMTEEAAKVFADSRILLFGNESQTVGPEDAPMDVHLIMLGAEIVLLEGIRLDAVEDGVYLLNAAPINLGGADGAPCRAFLLSV